MKSPLRLIAAVLLLAVAGCAQPNPAFEMPQITFEHEPPLKLAVDHVEVVNAYHEPLAPPHVEHKMETTPAQGLKTWARDRLKAVGDPNGDWARVTIQDAEVVEKKLPLTQGLAGTFTTDQAYRYTLSVKATVDILNTRGQVLASADAQAMRSKTTPENATLNDLHLTWFHLLEGGLKDYDKAMEPNIRKYLANWIR